METRENYRVSDYWDGGSRTYVVFYDLDTHKLLSAQEAGLERQTINNPFNANMGTVKLRPGLAAVESPVFRGKTMGLRIMVCEADLKRFE